MILFKHYYIILYIYSYVTLEILSSTMNNIAINVMQPCDTNQTTHSSIHKVKVSLAVKRQQKIQAIKALHRATMTEWGDLTQISDTLQNEIYGFQKTIQEINIVLRCTDNAHIRTILVESIAIFNYKITQTNTIHQKNERARNDANKRAKSLVIAFRKEGLKDTLAQSFKHSNTLVNSIQKYEKKFCAKLIDLNKLWKRITSDDVIGYIAEYLPAQVKILLMEQRINSNKLITKIPLHKKIMLFNNLYIRFI